jgi:hypothetical protein
MKFQGIKGYRRTFHIASAESNFDVSVIWEMKCGVVGYWKVMSPLILSPPLPKSRWVPYILAWPHRDLGKGGDSIAALQGVLRLKC